MGVGLELMGKAVRCPNCRQIVVAPSTQPLRPPTSDTGNLPSTTQSVAQSASQSASQSTPPEAGPPSEQGDRPLPTFAPPPREGVESIFGDEEASEDSLFGAPPPRKPLLLPDVSDSVDEDPPPSPKSSGMIDFQVPEEERSERKVEIPEPILKKDLSQPDFAILAKMDAPKVEPEPPMLLRADEVVDPFAKFGRMNATAPPAPRPVRRVDGPPTRTTPRYFWLVVAYAVVVTILAAWGWLRSTPHPFSTIPDFFGQYHSADRKKVSAIPIDRNLRFPDNLKVKLGNTLIVGDLEIEPLSIEERKTQWIVRPDHSRNREIECLVLTVRVKNRSKTPFYPFDPAFNRFAKSDEPEPLTAIVLGSERFPGGPIPWPFARGQLEYITGQEADEQPLGPGQERTTTIPAIDGDAGKRLLERLRAAKSPALWQIHVRRGMIPYGGQTLPVSAIVGVEFEASQITKAETKNTSG